MKKTAVVLFCIMSASLFVSAQENQEKKSCPFWNNWYGGVHMNALTYFAGDFAHGENPMRLLNDNTGYGHGFTIGRTFHGDLWGVYGSYMFVNDFQSRKLDPSITARTTDFRILRFATGLTFNLSNAIKRNDKRLVDIHLLAGIGMISTSGNHYIKAKKQSPMHRTDGSINAGGEIVAHVSKAVDIRFRSEVIGSTGDFEINNDKLWFKALWSNNIGVSYNFSAHRNTYTIDDVYEKVNDLSKKMDDFVENQKDILKNELQGLRKDMNESNDKVIKRMDDLKKELEEVTANSGMTYHKTLSPVFFGFNKVTLSNDQQALLEPVADLMKFNDKVKLTVRGFADRRGSAAVNQKVSEKRAEACKKLLIEKYGIAAERITVEGKGSVTSYSSSVDVLNRRVEFLVQ